jgi:hypothetical protein
MNNQAKPEPLPNTPQEELRELANKIHSNYCRHFLGSTYDPSIERASIHVEHVEQWILEWAAWSAAPKVVDSKEEQEGTQDLLREIRGEHDRLSAYSRCACWICMRIDELLKPKVEEQDGEQELPRDRAIGLVAERMYSNPVQIEIAKSMWALRTEGSFADAAFDVIAELQTENDSLKFLRGLDIDAEVQAIRRAQTAEAELLKAKSADSLSPSEQIEAAEKELARRYRGLQNGVQVSVAPLEEHLAELRAKVAKDSTPEPTEDAYLHGVNVGLRMAHNYIADRQDREDQSIQSIAEAVIDLDPPPYQPPVGSPSEGTGE